MSKTWCLTVEVESKAITNGLGYMIAFTLPEDAETPAASPQFAEWSQKVRDAVVRAGDQVFDPDPYTKKLAIAELMHTLADLNTAYDIKVVDGADPVPAVQIQSSNPYDNRIEIDFTDKDGHFAVNEKGLADLERRVIAAHGHIDVVDGARRHFPFRQKPLIAPVPPKKPKGPKP